MMDKERLESLREAKKLLDENIISEDEFIKIKTSIINQQMEPSYAHDGRQTASDKVMVKTDANDYFGIFLASWIFPIVGLIIWLVSTDTNSGKAESARNGFLFSLITYFIIGILIGLS